MLSRAWYVVVALVACAGLAVAALTSHAADRRAYDETMRALASDRSQVDLWLRLDARERIDALATVADDRALREALDPSQRAHRSQVPRDRVRARLDNLASQLGKAKGGALLVIDGDGEVVAEASKTKLDDADAVARLPLVKRALEGYARDGVWVARGATYRTAARPLTAAGRYVGAVVQAQPIDDEVARELTKRLPGAMVAFYRGAHVIAANASATLPTPPPTEAIAGALADAARQPGDRPRGSGVVQIAQGLVGVVTAIVPAGRGEGIGYVVVRRVGEGGAALSDIAASDVDALPWGLLILALVVLAGVGFLSLHIEHERPLRRLLGATRGLARADSPRLSVAAYRGAYGRLAEAIDAALRSLAERLGHPLDPPSEDAGGLLERRPQKDDAAPYFGFARNPATTPQPAPKPVPAPAP
ncbi:MAG: hypothetical protein KC543_16385, partial [Myxococcales bacterium]|nr:hypothetical protein [Myxococcales bacterium]